MDTLLTKISIDFPNLRLAEGPTFYWSPKDRIVYYRNQADERAQWSLLHEVSHSLLGHTTFNSDFELLLMEVAAWDHAAKVLAPQYAIAIDDDHIQDCLDTYRDWLYQRSTCPACTNNSFQNDEYTYTCFNCDTTWRVSASRHCRPYRKIQKRTTA